MEDQMEDHLERFWSRWTFNRHLERCSSIPTVVCEMTVVVDMKEGDDNDSIIFQVVKSRPT